MYTRAAAASHVRRRFITPSLSSPIPSSFLLSSAHHATIHRPFSSCSSHRYHPRHASHVPLNTLRTSPSFSYPTKTLASTSSSPSPFQRQLAVALLIRWFSSPATAPQRVTPPSFSPSTPSSSTSSTSHKTSVSSASPASPFPPQPVIPHRTATPTSSSSTTNQPTLTSTPTSASASTSSSPSATAAPSLAQSTPSSNPSASTASVDPAINPASTSSSTASTPPSILGTLAEPPPTRAQKLWLKVKQEVRHYVNGTKLLYAEIKIAAALTRQVLNGHELDRRERKQLTRTSADILRLVPFLVIMIVPFMEFALPVLLKFFPNMLPSTYLDHKGEEAKLKKQLAAKIEMARFLQDTTALMGRQLLEKSEGGDSEERKITVSSFQSMMEKVRRGESIKNSDILAVSRLFDEDFTLDNLNHQQLSAMCKLLDIRVFGSDWVLRYKLTKKLDELRDDDKAIQKEGVESLTLKELQEACRARGIHSGQTVSYMRRKLNDWLELSLQHDVPISLLVLSRAFSVSLAGVRDVELSEGLAATLKYMPDVVVEDTKGSIADQTEDVTEKLELIRKEEAEVKQKVKKPAQPKTTQPSVVGLAEIKEKLEDIQEDNDELEEDIDEAILEKEKGKRKGGRGEGKEGAIRLQAEVTSEGKAVEVVEGKSGAGEVREVREVKDKKVEKKKVQKVDALNDKVEELLDRVQAELKQHEVEQRQQERQQQKSQPAEKQ